jgi:hypothetical protein
VSLEIEGLEKGVYNIVPCIFDPKKEGTFKLTTSRGTLSELDPKKEYKELTFTVCCFACFLWHLFLEREFLRQKSDLFVCLFVCLGVVCMKGEWKGKTAGGCKNHNTFKYNKQFHIVVREPTRATIVLSQTEHEKFDPLGIYVVKTPGMFSLSHSLSLSLMCDNERCQTRFELIIVFGDKMRMIFQK